MKTNHRRTNKSNGYDYGYLEFCKRFKIGLGADHDNGRRGSAREIKQHKTLERRKKRRELNNLNKELRDGEEIC